MAVQTNAGFSRDIVDAVVDQALSTWPSNTDAFLADVVTDESSRFGKANLVFQSDFEPPRVLLNLLLLPLGLWRSWRQRLVDPPSGFAVGSVLPALA